MRHFLTLALALVPVAAQAQTACPPGATPILSCSFQNGAKWLTSCLDGDRASYAFGKVGRAPDLTLSTAITDLDYRPWPGVGSSIWEEVRFYNRDITYVLWDNYDKAAAVDEAQAAGAPDPLTAGIVVMRGEDQLARLECDPGSIDDRIDAIWPEKEIRGQCWDYDAGVWGACE